LLRLINTIVKFMASSQLAAVLILGLVITSTIGIAGYSQVFSSDFFIALGVLFLLNLLFCIVKQGLVLVQSIKCSLARPKSKIKRLKIIIVPGNEEPYKNSLLNKAGILIFHIGILAVTSGALISGIFGFTGKLGLFEGQYFNELEDMYTYTKKGIFAGDYKEDFGVFLHEIKPVEHIEKKPYNRADISVLKKGIEVYRGKLEEGQSKELGRSAVSFYNFGYSVELATYHPGQYRQIERIGLDTEEEMGYQQYVGSVEKENGLYYFRIEFLPDLRSLKKPLKTSSYELRNPVIHLQARKADKGKKTSELVFDGAIKAGESVRFNDGYMVTFNGFLTWAAFLVTKYNGIYTMFGGFILAVAGLILRYMIKITDI